VPIMKKIVRKEKIIKKICTLVIVFLFLSCSVPMLSSATDILEKKYTVSKFTNKYTGPMASSAVDFILLEENFTDGNIPPEGDSGDWSLQQTNPTETWYIDSTVPYTDPYCGTIHRDASVTVQDEWLITPNLDFNNVYSKISLSFHWYTCYYTTVYKRYAEFNISISTDGGVNWTNIWSFDDMDMGVPPNPFTDWKWYESNYLDQEPIDLSAYIGESDVRIAFQYYSNTTSSADQQEFSIDEINVIASGPGTNFTCDAGGPYSWWWMMQYEYFPNGVRFHGNVTNGTIFTQYLWDFGDGNTSISIPLNSDPVHFYNEIGTYIVTLTAKDTSFTPPRINISRTTVTLFLLKPPEINITAPMFSIGIKATINNIGDYNCSGGSFLAIVLCFGWINAEFEHLFPIKIHSG
ncbi:MAG: C-terminal target protein, partial [Thermoplasmatales archaeon]|nr:C-terminal target protein [Thermoplasmatales archaeon]